jgi:3D (Asp-Asp-Asp) domain-containing protein
MEVKEEFTPRPVVYRDDPNLEIGYFETADPGSDGHIRREYSVTYENGLLVSREMVSEKVSPPSERVVIRGTKAIPNHLLLPDDTLITYTRALKMYATWYNAASSGGDGITATGAVLDRGIVAVDPSIIPLGTRLYIPGYGFAVAADTGAAIVGYVIDLGYPGDTIGTCCTGWITVYVVE